MELSLEELRNILSASGSVESGGKAGRGEELGKCFFFLGGGQELS